MDFSFPIIKIVQHLGNSPKHGIVVLAWKILEPSVHELTTNVLFFYACSNLFTNSNWFAFQDDRVGNAPASTSPMEIMDEINLSGAANGGNSSSDDEVVVGEDDELTESKDNVNSTSTSNTNFANGFSGNVPIHQSENATTPQDIGFFRFDTPGNEDFFWRQAFP